MEATQSDFIEVAVPANEGPLRRSFVAAFRTMALVALHRLYQRTCRDCGYRWTVTRAQKQISVRQPVFRQRGVENAREALVETRERLIDPLRECARCGGIRFSERPVTKRRPADPLV
jgi:hypothetical protein